MKSASKFSGLAAVLLCLVIFAVASLFVLLLPEEEKAGSECHQVSYEITTTGDIIWKYGNTGKVKLVIESAIRSEQAELSRRSSTPPVGNCAQLIESSIEYINKSYDVVECFDVYSSKQIQEGCSLSNQLDVEDSILMQIPPEFGNKNKEVFWYGGSELYIQKWPINNISKTVADIYLSTDLPWRYGNVLERYWLSSSGVAIFVYDDVPLSVSLTENDCISLKASYNLTQFFGISYPPNPDSNTKLRYAVCIGPDALSTHKAVLGSLSQPDKGFIDRPSLLPDLRMIKDPIWSTWARYKSNINETVVETFAEEITKRNFTNSQLEIDDGYEVSYGDFTFDESKFPDPKRMIRSLKQKGFRVTTWVTPFINRDSSNYLTGRLRGYFVTKSLNETNPDLVTWWNGIGAVVDFTNPEAAVWYENLLIEVKTSYELDSFKFDAGETNYLPRNGHFYHDLRNPGLYTTLYAQSAYKIAGDGMEMRAAWKMQARPFFIRMMDKGSSWGEFKGLRTLIPTALTFGTVGYPYVLPDMIGGNAYIKNKPERELYIRWLEVTAFLPVMQFSITPWDYDEEVTEIARRYVEIHRTLIYDEIVRTARRYAENGDLFLPVSPIWYLADFTERHAFSCSDQFLVGSKYLVAPILTENARQRDIYLPAGSSSEPIKWRDMMRKDQGVKLGGQWIESYHVELDEISWWERIDN